MALTLRNPQLQKLTATPQRRTYTVIFATLLLVLLLVFFAIRPAVTSIFDRTSANKNKRKILGEMDTKYNNLLTLNSQEVDQAESLALLSSSIPEQRDEDFLVANMHSMVEKNNLEFASISITDKVKKSVLTSSDLGIKTEVAGFSLEVRGSRMDIIRLVEDMENFPKIINIYSISFAPAGETYGSNTISANVQAEIYYFNKDAKIVD